MPAIDENVIKRIMPHSLEAEQSVIGSMFIDTEAIAAATEQISGEDFYNRQYGIVFDTIVELNNEGKPVDFVTLQDRLRSREDVPPEVSGLDFLTNLIASVPTSANIKYYAGIVAEKATLRRLIRTNEEIANTCYSGKESLDTILESTESKINEVVQKKNVKESHCFDFGLLPTKGLQKEFRSFIENRSRQCALGTMIQERVIYQRFCRMVKDQRIQADSLHELEWEQWLLKIRSWLLEHGQKLTMQKVSVYGKEKIIPSSLITYARKAYQFTKEEEEQDEIEKDIWKLENLDIPYKKNLIKNYQTLNFTTIIQTDLREETKKAVYEHLHHEAIATISKEMTAIRRLSKYLKEKYPDIHSAEELDRELLEEYLTYLATEAEGVNNYRMDLTRLRGILETIGKLYGYPHLESLFLTSDFPKQVQPKLKSYSDSELIRFNAVLAELDEQIERLMVIHQMLGTRISDTLTLQRDCLYRQNGHPMIQIRQMKTNTFVKPISAELELLIEKAIEYTEKMYGDTIYIFVDEKNTRKPLQYNTVQNRVMDIIQKKDLRDDNGELFGFGTHMFRHVYGIRLTEMHLDDWTIAKLLGHTSVKNVKFYRKMSLQIIADETREIRAEMSRMIRANLAGWGKEYEQI